MSASPRLALVKLFKEALATFNNNLYPLLLAYSDAFYLYLKIL